MVGSVRDLRHLDEAVSCLDVPAGPDALREVLGIQDRLDAKVCAAVGVMDADGSYELDGSVTVAAWLRRNANQSSTTAHRIARRARKLRSLPHTLAAWCDGRLSGGQVDAILANVAGRYLGLFADHEAELIPNLEPLSAEDTDRVMGDWRTRAAHDDRDGSDPTDDAEPPSRVHLHDLLGGRGGLDGDLDADLNELLKAALRMAGTADLNQPLAERRAEALGELCRFFLDHQTRRSGGRHRPHLNVITTADDLANHRSGRYVDGPPLSPEELAVLACDAVLHCLVVDGRSSILDYGRATRVIPVDLWNAVVARDEHCRWPGCDRPASHCDGHHVWAWEHGGPTSIGNVVVLCRRHHRRIHHHGWQAKLLPDGTLELTGPDGTTTTTDPPGPIPKQFW